MPDEHICVECGAAFTVPDSVREKYPGWVPTRCRRCHAKSKGRKSPAAGSGTPKGPFGVEENLTVAEVLEKYTEGPTDGVFTDGSASPNPGPGGWGAVYVRDGEIVAEDWGHDPETTNNRMELTALIAGYDLVPEGVPTTVHTDSRLAVDTITKWAPTWAQQGWRRKSGPVQNLDLVRALYERAVARPEITLKWIKAHAGSRWNEYADALSTAYLRDQR